MFDPRDVRAEATTRRASASLTRRRSVAIPEGRAGRGHGKDREASPIRAIGPCWKSAPESREDVGQLLELQRPLPGRGVLEAPTEDDALASPTPSCHGGDAVLGPQRLRQAAEAPELVERCLTAARAAESIARTAISATYVRGRDGQLGSGLEVDDEIRGR
jgi:hypothetical protein